MLVACVQSCHLNRLTIALEKCHTDRMPDQSNSTGDVDNMVTFSPKKRIIALVIISFLLTIITFLILWPYSFELWNLSRALVTSVAIAVVLTIPPRVIALTAQRFLYVIGYMVFAITFFVLLYGRPHEGSGDEKVYEVCALTLPILLLAIVIDIRLFERPDSHPGLVFLILFTLVGGEGASLLALSNGRGSPGVFAWAVASMTGLFATIIASTIGKTGTPQKPKAKTSPSSVFEDQSISLLEAILLSGNNWGRSKSSVCSPKTDDPDSE